MSSLGMFVVRRSDSSGRSRSIIQRIFSNRQQQCVRWKSTAERLRVGIVGGGAAGLSCALHLAPLVQAGLIASPIDVFDAPPTAATPQPTNASTSTSSSSSSGGREIGVGIWSTALDPFLESDRESHALVYNEMTRRGTWVDNVGYRIPSGQWLLKSHLPTRHGSATITNNTTTTTGTTRGSSNSNNNMPSLLFLREKEMLQSLQEAVHWEEQRGMIRVHSEGIKTRVTGLHHESSQPWSAQLQLNGGLGQNRHADASFHLSERDYHLVIAADGTHSAIRQLYGGHDSLSQHRLRLTGTNALLSSPIELPDEQQQQQQDTSSTTTATASTIGVGNNDNSSSVSSSSSSSSSNNNNPAAAAYQSRNEAQRVESVGLQDRNYTVFRGNAQLSEQEMGLGGTSFQTWGLGQSMRYTTVPMTLKKPSGGANDERQIWFITFSYLRSTKNASQTSSRTSSPRNLKISKS